ncbi:MAG: SRPBCC domain-containing protein [Planctomycetaceae bacterium]|nr:SRPBCC domain-containing protein [Planctomycetaceae bacterium]
MKKTLKVTAEGDREIVVTRDFDAPRALVWDTMSRSELLKRWLFGPPGWRLTSCEDEQKVGGRFRWEWAGPEGAVMTMSGVYRELDLPGRCVRTEIFESGGSARMGEQPQMGEQLATLVLTNRGEKTTLTLTVLYPSKGARDWALAGGFDKGLDADYNRLEEFLAGAAVYRGGSGLHRAEGLLSPSETTSPEGMPL